MLMALLGEMTLVSGKVFLVSPVSREDLKPNPETGLTESVAYCAQQAWLVNATVKENIVFASAWDEKRYEEVILACSLKKDFEILDKGDETLIGEKGVTLSGGQKQRISLARALYSTARHVLLDDILSAVDAHTAKHIFEEAIQGPLMYNRTCILVTHNISLTLPHAEYAVVLDNGRVAAQGPAIDVIKSGKLGEDLTKSTQEAVEVVDEDQEPIEASGHPHGLANGAVKAAAAIEAGNDDESKSKAAPNPHLLVPHHRIQIRKVAGQANKGTEAKKDAMEETKATGGVKLKIIALYLRAMGSWFFWIFAFSSFVMQQLSNISTTVWIRQWANSYATQDYHIMSLHEPQFIMTHGIVSSPSYSTSGLYNLVSPHKHDLNASFSITTVGDNEDSHRPGFFLGVYAVLGLIYMAVTFFRERLLFAGSITASKGLHTRLMTAVTHAKFRFFDSTPLGQIMNRFSKDIEAIDQDVAPVAVGFVHCVFSILTIVILITVITPGFLIAGIFITILYFLIGKFYINSSRDLKRIESVQRSPLYQQFGETLSGMVTIRAYGDERRFVRENLNKINTHSRPFIYLWSANRWLAFRVDIAGALVSFFAGIFVVLSVGRIDAGAAGLAMTYAVTFTENVLWFVRLYAQNEQNMNSVERIKEYLDVEQEAPQKIPETQPPANWPSQGAVEFIGYSTRYRKDFDLVLKEVTFKIQAGEKVGVVGRTGAGKSSLALALFRALEAEKGKILVDDIDIGLIGLQDLREAIVMVPQDPTLFSGTIRSNLDPFGLFTDEEIFTALRRVSSIGVATAQPSPADTRPTTPLPSDIPASDINKAATKALPTIDVSAAPSNRLRFALHDQHRDGESGSNLSQGQRQLLCLARALLKDPRVLLMDEATASIDYATDGKIQETIRELKGNTIITIAHRLKTIVDYDKVVVMDKGEVVEYGAPWDLLRPRDDLAEGEKRWFKEMCDTSGEIEVLEQEAKKSWDAKRLVDDS
ncbi:hypothetical protein MRB53_038031 [Persea americana]|nr:hypothetical protein MRB53_038031 [Persea americana]